MSGLALRLYLTMHFLNFIFVPTCVFYFCNFLKDTKFNVINDLEQNLFIILRNWYIDYVPKGK